MNYSDVTGSISTLAISIIVDFQAKYYNKNNIRALKISHKWTSC